jgi:signal recognition particle subunit SRP54
MFGAPSDFTLDDFRKQFERLARTGSMRQIMASLPGIGDTIPEREDPEQALRRIQGMIDSMIRGGAAPPPHD